MPPIAPVKGRRCALSLRGGVIDPHRKRAVTSMKYLDSRWSQAGLALVVFGWGPLFGIGLLASVGLWPDPEPNPIGPGLLFFFTFWPAVVCLAVGAYRTWRSRVRRN